MKIDLSKAGHVLFFIVFLPAVALAIGWGFAKVLPVLPFWAETISPLGAYGLLYAFFERMAWHWPIFRILGVVRAPDLRGRWVGEQLSSHKDAHGKPVASRTVLEVQQTFTGITAKAYYHRWSAAHSASSFLDIEGALYLVIIFESEPGVRHDGGDRAHKGLARLRYNSEDQTITGTYFNSNGNFGEITLNRKSRRLLHRFAV
jgi:ribosomal protein S18 acetylase RimI-like enzyme